jgi:multidrug efflux pump subunit AcrB
MTICGDDTYQAWQRRLMRFFHCIGLGHDASHDRMSMFVMLFLLTAIATGCGPRVLPISKITVACPGFSAVEADELVALPLNNAIAGVPRIEDRVALSYPGRVEIYVTWEATEDQAALGNRLSSATVLLPVGVDPPIVNSPPAGGVIPAHPTGEEEVVLIQLDRDKLAALGISYLAAANACRDLSSARDGEVAAEMERLQSLTVNADGREVPFKDIAIVTIGTEPKCVVRR